MTCMKCRHWEQCVLPDGTTHYYGEKHACANVDHLCKWFVPKNEQPKWIPVTERLPEELQEVLTYSDFRGTNGFEDCEYQIAYLYNGKFNILNRPECVTHWMPLPQPPKEGE